MKPKERKDFFLANHQFLTEDQMANILRVGVPTIRNYEREFGVKCLLVAVEESKLLKLIGKFGLTENDAITALQSLTNTKDSVGVKHVPISRDSFKYGYFSDAHIGHKQFQPALFDYMVRLFHEEEVDFIVNPGDHLEGMSNRPGHVYELSHIGFDQQFHYALELYRQLDDIPHYGIDGNHDQWYYNKSDQGIIVGRELEKSLKNYIHLGQNEADLVIRGIKMKLFHGNDGSAYAISYKMQKLIESLSSHEKPHIIHSGHYHKAMNMYSRGVYGFECGTLSAQSWFMRGKKLPAHMGFGVVEVVPNEYGIERLSHTFVPWEERG